MCAIHKLYAHDSTFVYLFDLVLKVMIDMYQIIYHASNLAQVRIIYSISNCGKNMLLFNSIKEV